MDIIWNKIQNNPTKYNGKRIEIKQVEIEKQLSFSPNEKEMKSPLEGQKGISPTLKSLYFTNKKRGRIKHKSTKNNERVGIHDKYSDDNIKRKVKTHFHNFIIALLNKKSSHILNKRNRFGKISSNITQNITVEFNQHLFEQKIRDIVVKMSNKYQDKDKNSIIIQYILDNKVNNGEILNILNMKYKDLYLNFYLNSTKDIFEGEIEDESYESHLNKMEKLYGSLYVEKYKKNAETLISFFYKCKKRIRKKIHTKLINPLPFFNLYDKKGNNLNSFYNENNMNYNNILNGSNIMISTSTQTNMHISEDEEEN